LVDAAKLVKKSIFQTFFIVFFQYWKLFFVLKNNIGNFILCQKTIFETLFLWEKQYWKLYFCCKNNIVNFIFEDEEIFFCFQSLSLRNLYYICRVLLPESPTRAAGMKGIFLKRRYICALFFDYLRLGRFNAIVKTQSNIVMPGGMYFLRPFGLSYT
jgi:hypothetical protein